MRFAVIGAGVIGTLHAQTLSTLAPRAELAVVVDVVEERARELANQHSSERQRVDATTSVADALARSDVDAVTICTPSGIHADAAVAALDAGKHVVVEKPIDIGLDAAGRIREAAQRSGRTTMVVSQHRHDVASAVVAEALRTGQFGTVTSGLATIPWWRSQGYYDSGDWRGTWALDGGGALMNQGIHTIDLLAWFLGEPVEVYAWTSCLAHERIEVEDTAVATVRFASGALGTVHGTTAGYPGLATRIQVHGDRGSAVIEHDRLSYFHVAGEGAEEYAYGAGGSANQAEAALEAFDESAFGHPVNDEPRGASLAAAGLTATSHTGQFRDFLDAVEQGRSPLVTVEQATRTLALIRGIYESVRTSAPVTIKELTR